MNNAILILLGICIGYGLRWMQERDAAESRAAALRGDPPRRLRQRGETRL